MSSERAARAAKVMSEEPDALIGHVRVCGGPGGQPLGLPGRPRLSRRMMLCHVAGADNISAPRIRPCETHQHEDRWCAARWSVDREGGA